MMLAQSGVSLFPIKRVLLVIFSVFLLLDKIIIDARIEKKRTLQFPILATKLLDFSILKLSARGGAVMTNPDFTGEGEINDYDDSSQSREYDPESALWLLNQVHLYQARVALLSKELRKTGHLTGLHPIIQEPRANKLEIALSTEKNPMPCRIYFHAEDGAKVVAPCKCKGSQKWIQWSALNQQYRTEPEKWHACSVCRAKIDYKQYQQFASASGQLLSALLDHQGVLRLAMATCTLFGVVIVAFLFQSLIIQILLSACVWNNYDKLLRVIYMALPLQILVFQFAYKWIKKGFDAAEKMFRDHLIEWESSAIENALPVTTFKMGKEAFKQVSGKY